eukprot:7693_1
MMTSVFILFSTILFSITIEATPYEITSNSQTQNENMNQYPSKSQCAINSTWIGENLGWQVYKAAQCESYIETLVSSKKSFDVSIQAEDTAMFKTIKKVSKNEDIQIDVIITFLNTGNVNDLIEKAIFYEYPIRYGMCFVKKWWDNKQVFDFIVDGYECGIEVGQSRVSRILYAYTGLNYLFSTQTYSAQLKMGTEYFEYRFDYY